MYVLSRVTEHDTYVVVNRYEVFQDAVRDMMAALQEKPGITMRIDNDELKEFKIAERKMRK